MSMQKSFVAAVLLTLLSYGCKPGTSISGVVYPQHSLKVNESYELTLMLALPAGDELVRWQTHNGKCESKDEHSLSCRYLAERAGDDTVTVEVLKSGRVVAKTSIIIHVDAATSPGEALVSVVGPGIDAGDLNAAELEMTVTPPFGIGSRAPPVSISGRIMGIDPNKISRLSLLIYAGSENLWFVQPYEKNPITSIDSDGSWSTSTHLGSEYALLLVPKSYTNPPATTDGAPPSGPEVLKGFRLRKAN